MVELQSNIIMHKLKVLSGYQQNRYSNPDQLLRRRQMQLMEQNWIYWHPKQLA